MLPIRVGTRVRLKDCAVEDYNNEVVGFDEYNDEWNAGYLDPDVDHYGTIVNVRYNIHGKRYYIVDVNDTGEEFNVYPNDFFVVSNVEFKTYMPEWF